MRALGVTLAFGCATALMVPAARAEPISLTVSSPSSGFTADETTFTTGMLTIDLGSLSLKGGSSGFISVDGLQKNKDYVVTFDIVDPAASPWTELTAEVLDPRSDGLNAGDPAAAIANQPSYVPADFSTSTTHDGLSFAQSHGLERSAMFAGGGSATVLADEMTNTRDLITFSGFSNGVAHVTFGLRDYWGGRNFLLRLSVNGGEMTKNPEPASMVLLGTGLLGLIGYRRQRSA